MVYRIYLLMIIVYNSLIATRAIQWEENTETIEELYIEKYRPLSEENEPNTDAGLCKLPNERKLAICKLCLELINGENTSFRHKHEHILLNKTAAINYEPNCVTNVITLRKLLNNLDRQRGQNMFPCYGRHEPMRTNWYTDDYIDTFFLFGYSPDLVFIVRNFKMGKYNIYSIMYTVVSLGIDNLPPLNITQEEIDEELKSLQNISINNSKEEIERSYLRAKIMTTNEQPDPVCALDTESKLALCVKLLESTDGFFDGKFIVNKIASEDDPLVCVKQTVIFVYLPGYNKNFIEKKDMYPCYEEFLEITTKTTRQFFLASGYRENSVIVFENDRFTRRNVENPVNFYRFYENVNLLSKDLKSTTGVGKLKIEGETSFS